MLFQINGLEISNLQKAKDDKTVTVDIIANHLTEDDDGETTLKEAFDKETVDNFISLGIIDFWHETDNEDLSKEDQNKYMIGKPIAFHWENGKPVVTASLTKSHPIVKDMLPHLEAGLPMYAGSIAGKKWVLQAEDSNGAKHRIIPKIKWDKLAIAPTTYVINRAGGMNVRLSKAKDIMCEFDNVNSFISNRVVMGREEELRKALEAPGSVGDMYDTSGGVVTKQDIEKKSKLEKSLSFDEDESLALLDTVIEFKNKKIPTDEIGYKKHFEKQNKKSFGDKSFDLISKYFKLKKGVR
jgi:hypothetical protein